MNSRIFTWVETRAKSELRVRLVPTFKHVEAFQYFFYGGTVQLLLIVFHVYLRNAVFIYI